MLWGSLVLVFPWVAAWSLVLAGLHSSPIPAKGLRKSCPFVVPALSLGATPVAAIP